MTGSHADAEGKSRQIGDATRRDPTLQTGPPPLTPEQEERLSALLDEYFQSLERGQPLDAMELAARHPEIAEHLREYLKSIEFLQGAAVGFRPAGSSESGDATDPLVSRQLGDYRIVREVGRGGMGVVYEAWQDSLKRRVALKVLPFAALLDAQQVARFRHEAQAAARLQHAHIVPVYAVGAEQGLHYYAMQFIDGVALDRVVSELRRRRKKKSHERKTQSPSAATRAVESLTSTAAEDGPTSHALPAPYSQGDIADASLLRATAALVAQAADALQAAHEAGVVHRDIKPSNLLLDGEGHLWVTDFGLARNRGDVELTKPGDFVGTMRYMSPEQARGPSQLVDARTDVYSLGATLYELLTLHPATRGENSAELLKQLEEGRPYAPRSWNPAIPFDLETIVLKSLAHSRDDRYGTAREFGDDLRRFVAGDPIVARRPSLADRAARFGRRHRTSVLAGFVVVALALIGLVVATTLLAWQQRQLEWALRSSRESFERYRDQLAFSHRQLALIHEQLGDVAEADRYFQESLRLYREALADSPSSAGLRWGYAAAMGDLAVLRETIDANDADQLFREAAKILEELAQESPADRNLTANLALIKSNQGLFWSRVGRLDDAVEAFREAQRLWGRLHESAPSDREVSRDRAVTQNNLGRALQRLQRYEDAAKVFREAVESLPEEIEGDGQRAADYSRRGGILNNLGLALKHLGRRDDAIKAFDDAIEWQNRACQAAPKVDRFKELLEQHRLNRENVDQTSDLVPSLGID